VLPAEYSANQESIGKSNARLGGSLRRTNMPKFVIAALLLVSFVAPLLAAETFYIVFDATLHGCTIATAEPSDKSRHKILGKYQSQAEAEEAIASMKEC
jgi:hypothetical protein